MQKLVLGCLCTGLFFFQNDQNLKYLYIHSASDVDTVNTILISERETDNDFVLSYKNFWNSEFPDSIALFRFPKEPKKSSSVNLIKVKGIRYHGKEYLIYKYLYDDPNIADEEMLYFYSQDLGIIIFKSVSWGGYYRLIELSDINSIQAAFYLGEKIISDKNFFNNWK